MKLEKNWSELRDRSCKLNTEVFKSNKLNFIILNVIVNSLVAPGVLNENIHVSNLISNVMN